VLAPPELVPSTTGLIRLAQPTGRDRSRRRRDGGGL